LAQCQDLQLTFNQFKSIDMRNRIKKTDLVKAWAQRAVPSFETKGKLPEFTKILIVTQDGESSRLYFKGWKSRLHGASTIIKVISLPKNPVQLVADLKTIRNQIENHISKENNAKFCFGEVWVAFDKDSFADFDSAVYALRRLSEQGYREAWSNECFELWYLLHFMKIDGGNAISREDLFKWCDDAFNKDGYKKGDISLHSNMSQKTFDEIGTAICRAKKLEEEVMARCGPNAQPSLLNPMTKVYLLIEKLMVRATLSVGQTAQVHCAK